MTITNLTKPTTGFWSISIIAILWNLSGVASFFMEVFITAEALAVLPESERALYETNPLWMKIVFAIAVFDGILGGVLLLMRKALAIPVFIISLVAVLIQMSYSMFMTDVAEVLGSVSIAMSLLIIAISIFLVWYSRSAKAKKWIG